jgi:hypothetical protein
MREGRIKQKAGAPDVRELVDEAKAVAPLREAKIKVSVHQAEVDPVGVLLDLRGIVSVSHGVRQRA